MKLNGVRLWNRQSGGPDILAGVTVSMMLIPQGMAYAMLAGLPPITGLYASIVPIILYSLFGSSRHLAIGPVAIISIALASTARQYVSLDLSYAEICILLAIMVGVFMALFGLLRLGFLVNFVSHPLISGFTSAAVVMIIISQLPHLLGLQLPLQHNIFEQVATLVAHVNQLHLPTFAMGLGCFVVMGLVERWLPKVPSAIVLILGCTLVTAVFDLDQFGIATVGNIPGGLPSLTLPSLNYMVLIELAPVAITLAFLGYVESVAIARRMADEHRYELDANRELVALGLANIGSGLFGAYPVAGSFGRTAVNNQAGAQSQLSGIVAALVVALTLLFLTPLFYYLPTVVLAIIIIRAVSKLFDIHEAVHLYKIKRSDFTVLVFAFAATLIWGVIPGILLSVALSIILIIRRISHPHIALMGQVPGTTMLRNVKREHSAEILDGIIIFRIDASLYFANIRYMKEQLLKAVYERESPVDYVIIDASSINEIDTSAIKSLFELNRILGNHDIKLWFTNVKGPVRDFMQRSGFYEAINESGFYLSKKAAVQAAQEERSKLEKKK